MRIKSVIDFITLGSKLAKHIQRRQYDPIIIEMAIDLVLGPLSSLYRPYLRQVF